MGFGRGKGFSPVVPPPPPPVPGVQSNDCQLEHNGEDGPCQYWNARSQTFTPDHDYMAVGLSLLLTKRRVDYLGPLIIKLELDEMPCWEATVLWSQAHHANYLPDPGDYRWTHFVLPDISLTQDTVYRITVHTTPGWEPGEPQAALYWRVKTPGNPYPRGSAWYGCNYRDESGSWLVLATADHAFCVYEIE
ncbi:hypothetical protein ES703_09959 [subsurface metagenome]